MNFLGLYNLIAALAVAGACGACDTPDMTAGYGGAPSYMSDEARYDLPPAGAIINRPPTRVDNGYNPTFYWNQPADEETGDADYDDEGGDYRGHGYSANYPQPAYSAPVQDYAAVTYGGDADTGYSDGGYGYYGPGEDVTGYGRQAYFVAPRERREHREIRHDRDQAPDMNGRDRRGENRAEMDRAPRGHQAAEHRGYNGHDARMFDADHHPAKPAPAGYQVHGGDDRGHPEHQHQ